jgi:hypothetical protein
MVYKYQKDKNQIEGFSMDKEIALRSLLFTLVFYLIASPQTAELFIGYLPKSVDVLIVQALLFSLIFYIVSLYL